MDNVNAPVVDAGSADFSQSWDNAISGDVETELLGGEPSTDEAVPADDKATDEPAAEETTGEEAPAEEADEQAEEGEEDPVEAAAAEETKPKEEELPEDVVRQRVDKNGKKLYELEENRYKRVYGNHKKVQEVELALGEPLTPELVSSLREDSLSHQAMLGDYLSPDGHDRFVQELAAIGDNAVAGGRLAENPAFAIGQKFAQYVLNSNNDAAIRSIAAPVLENTIRTLLHQGKKIFQESGGKDGNLLYSAQHIEKLLFGKHTHENDIRLPDPIYERLARAEALEKRAKDQQRTLSEQQHNNWLSSTRTEVNSALDGAVDKVLEPYSALGKDLTGEPKKVFESKLKELRGKLRADLNKQIGSDRQWSTIRSNEIARAKGMPEQARLDLKKNTVTQYANKASFLLDPERNTSVRTALSEAAQGLKQTNAAKHRRLEESASRREPGSIGGQVQKRIVPPKDSNLSSREQLSRMIDAELGLR